MADDPRVQLLAECNRTTTEILIEAQTEFGQQDEVEASMNQQGLGSVGPELLNLLARLAEDVAKLRAYDSDKAADTGSTSVLNEEELSSQLDEAILATYKKFYDFVYSDLPYCWRQLYTDLSILKFNYLFGKSPLALIAPAPAGSLIEAENEAQESASLDGMVKTLDMALINAGGAGQKRGRRIVEKMLLLLEQVWQGRRHIHPQQDAELDHSTKRQKRDETSNSEDDPGQQDWSKKVSFSNEYNFGPRIKRQIPKYENISMEKFQNYLDQGKADGAGPLPIIIKGLMDDWPAMGSRPWSKPAYLASRTFEGRRLVPVEVGRSYVDDGWGQELIPFRELLRRIDPNLDIHTDIQPDPAIPPSWSAGTPPSPEPISYLAQHELFNQLPILRNDILVPDLCYTSPPPHPLSPSKNKPEAPAPLLNAWLGPAGTITPLHTDAYHNLLCQAVGAKYVRLYAPADTEAVGPRGEEDGIDMANTSAFDVGVVEGWDPRPEGWAFDDIELAEFRALRCWDCVLRPGETLYIPIGWWHYVRSLSVSFSVSFWWNGDHYVHEAAGEGHATGDTF